MTLQPELRSDFQLDIARTIVLYLIIVITTLVGPSSAPTVKDGHYTLVPSGSSADWSDSTDAGLSLVEEVCQARVTAYDSMCMSRTRT